MHETPHGFFHLDHPAEGAVLPAGPVALRGWAAGKHGRPLVDLRLRVGPVTTPAAYGFPRADLAAHFGMREPFLLGGFEATLLLSAGGQVILFEALDINGQWQPIGQTRLSGQGPAAVPVPAAVAPLLLPHDFSRALQHALRRTAAVSAEQAADESANALPRPAVIRYPHHPFHGHLHQPALLERVLFGRLRIEGWLFHESQSIRRITATVDLQTWQDLSPEGTLPHVAEMFPKFPQARSCVISGLIDVPAQLPNPLCIRLYAELADGTWHLCQVVHTQAWDQEQEKAPFAPFSTLKFLRAVIILRQACLVRGFVLPPWDRPLWTELRGVYRDYKARAAGRKSDPVRARPAGASPAPPLPRAILITHNLSQEGAPLFLLELARHLVASGTRVRLISAQDGPLADAYVQLGVPVQVVDTTALRVAKSRKELNQAMEQLARIVPLFESELVIANTLSAFWGIHLARRAGRPSLFYIHESTTPACFYLGHMAPDTLPLIEDAFRLATHVSFLTETTRAYYRPWLGATNHSINPGWIDVNLIDRYLATHPRGTMRRELALDAASRLVINVGTVCDRKGQHLFARAVDLLWRQNPALAAAGQFLMIGGHDTGFDRDLQRLLVQLDRPNLRIVPATPAPLAYYRAADLFVCSSYEESFPRVIMEAMACGVPVLSTAVHGIRDLLSSGVNGWLLPAGHTQAMAEGLQHLLANPELAQALAARARTTVVANFDASLLLPRHAALAATIAAGENHP